MHDKAAVGFPSVLAANHDDDWLFFVRGQTTLAVERAFSRTSICNFDEGNFEAADTGASSFERYYFFH